MTDNARNQTTWVILARGRKVRHWRLSTMLACATLTIGLASAGGAAVGFSVAEPVVEIIAATDNSGDTDRIVESYERRILGLRKQIEKFTAQQQAERRSMEQRIAILLDRQRKLTERQGKLGSVLQRAATIDPGAVPAPAQRPTATKEANAGAALTPETLAAFLPNAKRTPPTPFEVFDTLSRSMETVEETQRTSLKVLAQEATHKADTIAKELRSLGFAPTGATGGPFIAVDQPFETSIDALDAALDRLEAAKEAAVRAPIGHPVAGQSMSSQFGPRRDPFNRRRAMHSGVDFRAVTGHPIRATGAGRVVKAGPNGGYGRFVEIDHGNGVTTRYAHMHRIAVRKGERIAAGQKIGTVGSTGRSTGPHLHYEVRKHGKAIDPLRFIRTGRSVARYL